MTEAGKKKSGDWTLWVAVLALFALLLGAWTVMFTVANRNPVQSVPLEHQRPEAPRP
jgi:hypothetical protein